jgi:hypothetical protein
MTVYRFYIDQVHMKNSISLIILTIIGTIFVYKYSFNVNESVYFPYLVALIFSIIQMALFTILVRFNFAKYAWASERRLIIVILALLILGVVVIIAFLPVTSTVTRLPAIVEWIGRVMKGEFPWGNQTRFNPSGLPFLFIFALPFYYLGNVGYLEIVGVVLFCVSLTKLYPKINTRWLPVIVLLFLPTFYYELLVRSDLFFNMVLIVSLIILSERYLEIGKLNLWFFGLAVLFGLCLSTRTIVGVIYAGYYAYKFRTNIVNGIFFSGLSLFIFGLTLAPFLVWNAQQFFAEGPFSVQLSALPSSVALLFVIMAAIVGWKASYVKDVLFGEGVLLFFIAAVPFILTVINYGIPEIVFKDRFDISYFIFCTPFLLLSLS